MGAIAADGFSIRPDVLTPDECDGLIEVLHQDGRAGTRHLMSHPAVQAIAHDRRLLAIAGEACVPFRATLFHKTSKANWLIPWHQDTALPLANHFDDPAWGPWSRKSGVWYAHAPQWALQQIVALRVHLDPSTADNGPLRVIPGSHHKLLTDEQLESMAHQSGHAIDCLAPKGGVIAMRPLIIHASSKIVNDLPRRVLHIEYAPAFQLYDGSSGNPGIELARA